MIMLSEAIRRLEDIKSTLLTAKILYEHGGGRASQNGYHYEQAAWADLLVLANDVRLEHRPNPGPEGQS